MLSNFFQLDAPFTEFDEAALTGHFAHSHDLRSVLYKPDHWPTELRRLKQYTFTNVSLSKTAFDGHTFTDCQFKDCLFIGSTFANVEFHRCQFIDCNFYKARFDNCYIDPRSFSFDKSYRRNMANIGVHIYQQLYENSSKARQSDFEMRADIEFRKWKRWQLTYDHKSGKINWLDRLRRSASSLIYQLASGFGYRPWRFILITIALFTLMSLINMELLSGIISQNGQPIGNMALADGIFYTYSMLTALGFSTIVPDTSFAKILAVSEALGGIGWLGVFTSLLVKRFIR